MPDSEGSNRKWWLRLFSKKDAPARQPNDLVIEGLAKMGEADGEGAATEAPSNDHRSDT